MANFTGIEDIVDKLTSELEQRGFDRIESRSSDVNRPLVEYEKRRENSPIFRVGLRQSDEERELTVHLDFEYDVPTQSRVISEDDAARIIFPPQSLQDFFIATGSYIGRHNITGRTTLRDGRLHVPYHIDFKKGKESAEQAMITLREFVTHVYNIVEENFRMLRDTTSLRGY